MTLPRFFRRAADAAAGLNARLTEDVLAQRLENVTVELSTDVDAADPLAHGYLLAANLFARLYPRLRLAAPPGLLEQAASTLRAINPGVEIPPSSANDTTEIFRLHVGWPSGGGGVPEISSVVIDAAGWTATVEVPAPNGLGPASAPAALAAGALGVSEIFRAVFGMWVDVGGRQAATPAVWDLVTGECRPAPDVDGAKTWTAATGRQVDIGTVHLAGAGAVGEAAVLTWRAADVTGCLVPVDHETVDVGNLQRYVLTVDTSEGKTKTAVVADALAGSRLTVQPVTSRWGEDPSSGPGRGTVAVALDTADARIAVAAGVHSRVYNAWTGPVDLGWSRHETFGQDEPCLACLYWPRGPQPSLHEQIALAVGQHPLRIRMYLQPGVLLSSVPAVIQPMPGQPLPAAATDWLRRSLLDDLVADGRVPNADAQQWAPRHVLDLWHEGVCGGTVVTAPGHGTPVEVPLAHQSALAGIMLAAQVIIASNPGLARQRDIRTQGRLDVRRALPQSVSRPRKAAPNCLCRDADFRGPSARLLAENP